MAVVLLSTDLAVQSRVEGASLASGKQLRVAGSAARLFELCDAERVEVVMVDLSTTSAELQELVAQLRNEDSGHTAVVAFGPHVHEEKLAAARAAGCDLVLSR